MYNNIIHCEQIQIRYHTFGFLRSRNGKKNEKKRRRRYLYIQLFFTCRSPKKQHRRAAAGNRANDRDGLAVLQWRIGVMPKQKKTNLTFCYFSISYILLFALTISV